MRNITVFLTMIFMINIIPFPYRFRENYVNAGAFYTFIGIVMT
ncbi:MAG: hypothetical protein AAGC88_01860 [Bacteroidota bacterium]